MNKQPSDFRRWHYLRHNKGCSAPSNLLFIDVATTPMPIDGKPNSELQVLKKWRACNLTLRNGNVTRETWHQGETPASFWTLLGKFVNERKPLWVFGHNIGLSLTVLEVWQAIEHGYLCFKVNGEPYVNKSGKRTCRRFKGFAVIDDPPVIVRVAVRDTFNVIVFVDADNYFRGAFDDLRNTVRSPGDKITDTSVNDEGCDNALTSNIYVIRNSILSLIKFIRTNNLGNFGYTIPSQAMSAFKHRFMTNKILCHGNSDAVKLEREAYFGGLNECYWIGRVEKESTETREYLGQSVATRGPVRIGPVYVLDINSCYPSVMIDGLFPTKLVSYVTSPSIGDAKRELDKHAVIARVQIKSTSETFPIRLKGKLYYARGSFVTTLCGNELVHALYSGSVASIGAMATYEQSNIFTDYVRFFWDMRQRYTYQGNKCYADLCKLYLNSLFGKFGQRSHHWEDCDDVFPVMPWGSWATYNALTEVREVYRSLGWNVQRGLDPGESLDSFPAIAAYVTMYARRQVLIYRHIACIENVYYIDTDSLHVSETGYNHLIDSNSLDDHELGKLKLVGVYPTAEYRGLKDYRVGENNVICGIRKDALSTESGIYRMRQQQRLRSILCERPAKGVRVDSVTIDRRVGLEPGRVRPDGTVETLTLT